MPSMNKKENSGLFGQKDFPHHYLIINWGDYGKLRPEVFTLRLSFTYWS